MATLGTPGLAALAAANHVSTSAIATAGAQFETLLRSRDDSRFRTAWPYR